MTIKREPSDFSVEEILSREIVSRVSSEPGALTLYRLTKHNLTTIDALERIAGRIRVPPRSIGYAGLKDRHASTVQYVTIPASRAPAEGAPEVLEMRGVRLERIGWLADRITADAIAGNRFRITVRDLTRRRCAELDTRRIFLSVPPAAGRSLRFVNYYGEQRFGSARHGRGIAARSLIRGNFGEALRLLVAVPDRKDSRARRSVKLAIAARWGNWKSLARALPPCPERAVVDALAASGGDFSRGFSALPYFIRQMTVEAYQSWLWNEIARRLVAALCEPPLVRSASRFGDLLFPRGTGVPPEVASMVVPLLSPRTRLKSPWKPIVEEVLNDEGISLGDLRVPGFRTPYFGEVERRVVVEAQEFRLGPLERDESATDPTRFKRSVRFFLPRGSYGTVLLRALGSKPYPIPG